MVKLKIEHSFIKSLKFILPISFILICISCRPNDEDDEEPPRDYLEQSLEDDQKLVQYLNPITTIIKILVMYLMMTTRFSLILFCQKILT